MSSPPPCGSSPPQPRRLILLRRTQPSPNDTGDTGPNGYDISNSSKDTKNSSSHPTLEERQQQYNKARARIFGTTEAQANAVSSDQPSQTADPRRPSSTQANQSKASQRPVGEDANDVPPPPSPPQGESSRSPRNSQSRGGALSMYYPTVPPGNQQAPTYSSLVSHPSVVQPPMFSDPSMYGSPSDMLQDQRNVIRPPSGYVPQRGLYNPASYQFQPRGVRPGSQYPSPPQHPHMVPPPPPPMLPSFGPPTSGVSPYNVMSQITSPMMAEMYQQHPIDGSMGMPLQMYSPHRLAPEHTDPSIPHQSGDTYTQPDASAAGKTKPKYEKRNFIADMNDPDFDRNLTRFTARYDREGLTAEAATPASRYEAEHTYDSEFPPLS